MEKPWKGTLARFIDTVGANPYWHFPLWVYSAEQRINAEDNVQSTLS